MIMVVVVRDGDQDEQIGVYDLARKVNGGHSVAVCYRRIVL